MLPLLISCRDECFLSCSFERLVLRVWSVLCSGSRNWGSALRTWPSPGDQGRIFREGEGVGMADTSERMCLKWHPWSVQHQSQGIAVIRWCGTWWNVPEHRPLSKMCLLSRSTTDEFRGLDLCQRQIYSCIESFSIIVMNIKGFFFIICLIYAKWF